MRYVADGDLRSVVRREGPLPGDRVVSLLSPVASALDAAHAAGLVHRDVKPANILVDSGPGRPEHPYLSDFGLAKRSASASLTEAGQFVGTLDYAAPEQIAGRPAVSQTDQYALACVAFTALTGALPFGGRESMAVLWAHMYEAPPSACSLRRDLPPPWTRCWPGRSPSARRTVRKLRRVHQGTARRTRPRCRLASDHGRPRRAARSRSYSRQQIPGRGAAAHRPRQAVDRWPAPGPQHPSPGRRALRTRTTGPSAPRRRAGAALAGTIW
jgi:serine/threonine protein kinase